MQEILFFENTIDKYKNSRVKLYLKFNQVQKKSRK